ncbi:formate dehydrogenase accessory sulfurtransferase FdhD [Meridianimarinicoccus aquatilis]|uniref:Sulfur carrier protein FdhD n=1 Tax=Meridianimarinicoccus aquatilis TaxID=2552766 RepID=A0A4R6AM66_9RHOB|nr:formate dehydrogenase accessory sulfurtransferase FdhD [Fluviibacterium aquatile]TDL84807.1 formate dehydrogenase accessory sulfurtransferase FdhD [Fluviibacterium aquatile]
MPHPLRSMPGMAVRQDGRHTIARALPEETPVAIVMDGSTQAVMMTTPADLEDFAKGFALTEGFIASLDEVESFEIVEHGAGIEARFWLQGDRAAALKTRRRAMLGPVGCGLCGIDSLEQALRPLPQVGGAGLRLDVRDVASATDELRKFQPLHDQTRAVHAAGFLRPGAGIGLVREDVGRHNALDKLIGAMARDGLNARGGAFVLTSRVSVEMVQKCAMAGCPVLIAASAPTARALRLAQEAGITLAAFVRAGGFDLYSHPHRIQTGASDVA